MSNHGFDSFIYQPAVAKSILFKSILFIATAIALLFLTSSASIAEKVAEPVALKLPVSSMQELKRIKGKRVKLVQDLVVSDLYGAGYGLGNYGQFAISSKLHFQPTELMTAAEVLKNPKILTAKEKDYLLVDDGSMQLHPSYIPFPNKQGFSATNSLRIGDTLKAGSIGTLRAYKKHYIFIPEINLLDKNTSEQLNIQPAKWQALPEVDSRSNLVVASMNLGNYFNGNFNGKPKRKKGFPTARGAKTYQGFQLQTAKIVSALKKIDADIIALMEIENDGYGKHSAIADLTRALNSSLTGSLDSQKNHYRYVIPNKKDLHQGKLGHSAISVGLLYRKNTVKLVGDAQVFNAKMSKALQTKVRFNDKLNRPSLIQKFKQGDQTIVIAVNHFKSKGKRCKTPYKADKADQLQGNCNQTRKEAAIALTQFLSKQFNTGFDADFERNSDNILILGDLNSYSQEDPLLALYNSGYSNLNTIFPAPKPSFSYSHQGYLGNLDHGLVNKKLLTQVRSFDAWHINSVEDVLLDYNTEKNGHEYPAIDHYGEPDEKRSSDHDPLIIGIELR